MQELRGLQRQLEWGGKKTDTLLLKFGNCPLVMWQAAGCALTSLAEASENLISSLKRLLQKVKGLKVWCQIKYQSLVSTLLLMCL